MEKNSEGSVALPPGVRLLIVTTVPEPIRNFLLPYADHYRNAGWTVEAATSKPERFPQIAAHFDRVHSIPWSRSIRHVGNLTRALPQLRDLLRDSRPDIVHVHTPIAGFGTRAAIRTLPEESRPAVVYTAHGFHFYHGGPALANLAYLTAERVAGRWTDRLVVINDEDETAARRWRVVPARNLVHLPGIGIDVSRYDRSQLSDARMDEARRGAGVPAGGPMFVMVAELYPNKRPQDAVRALQLAQTKDAHLVLAGAGPLRPQLIDLAERLGVTPRVHLPGFVDDIPALIASATASMILSDREGLSRALMESLCLGVPAIVSPARGNLEIVGQDAGVVVPPRDVAALARAMDALASDPDARNRMGVAGRSRIRERFSLPGLLAAHDRIYCSVLDDRAMSREAQTKREAAT